jgi:hypothetical protein
MNRKIIGFVLLGLGVVLLYFGYNASQSVGAQLSKALSGSLPEKSMMYYAGGAICTAAGAFLAFWSSK